MAKHSDLTGKEKAAVLLIALGPEVSSQVFKHLSDEEIEDLTLEIANVRKIDSQIKNDILFEFHQLALAQDFISQGGINYAKDVLEKALGPQKAAEIIAKLTSSLQVKPFDFVRKTDPQQLLSFIQNEHPQTIALILAYLKPEQSAMLLSGLPADKQAEITRRIAVMSQTSPDVIRDVERVLERKVSSLVTQDYTNVGGVETVVKIINRVDRTSEKNIMENLELNYPDLAEEIKLKMFVFEDLVMLDDRSVQRVLREVDSKDLALALKSSSEDVQELIFRNVSKRAAETLKEDMEYMGPVRLRDVEEAQQKIVNIVRRLEDNGEIIISRGGEDDLVV
jgi:flagellar motor switch protein FliG